jgi:uncharacterized membrane protein
MLDAFSPDRWLDALGTSWGALTALLCMAIATYLCRLGGVWLMDHLPPSPALRRALNALPGSIIVATVVPLGVMGGPPALIALGVAMLVMFKTRRDVLALAAGMLTVALLRRMGL